MSVKIQTAGENLAQIMAAAMRSEDPAVQAEAWQQFHQSVTQRIMTDFEDLKQTNDAAILSNRGYRILTSAETQFYNGLIQALNSPNPKQSFVDIIGESIEGDIMPETIIEDVYRNLQDEYPLLSAINFTYVQYATKWVLNDHTAQKAVWGAITDEITKQVTSGFKVVDVNQNKLSAYAFIERGMLDLGPTFLDAYVRAVLEMAIYAGLEYGFIRGTGVNEPIGMIRDIHEGVSYSTTDGYPSKTAVAVTSIDPASYGALLAPLTQTESGNPRKFQKVTLLCNQHDYLTKIMPATTTLTQDGRYVTGLFPFPTDVIVTNELENNEAVIGVLDEYHGFAGNSARNGVIEFSDEFKFTDDTRYFKVVQYATGRAFDNTSFILLDITNLAPIYATVNSIVSGSVETTASV